jgi:hypothetical protein
VVANANDRTFRAAVEQWKKTDSRAVLCSINAHRRARLRAGH